MSTQAARLMICNAGQGRISLAPLKGVMLGRRQIGELISSTKIAQILLHRTSVACAENIQRTGLRNALQICQTATWSPQDGSSAFQNYQKTHKGSTHVVVIEFPISDQAIRQYRKLENYDGLDGMVIDLLVRNNRGDADTVPARYIKGYLEVSTGLFIANPAFDPLP
jgi:hypothetical protein